MLLSDLPKLTVPLGTIFKITKILQDYEAQKENKPSS